MTLEEIDPELFSYELYNPYGINELDVALCVATRIGYCDASRLLVRPKAGMVAIMVEWEDGSKDWYHANTHILESIRYRLARRKD